MSGHLMMVEDDAAIRVLLASYLRDRGYTVTEAATVDDFDRHFAAHRFDLILLDLALPGRDGMTLLSTVREHSRAPVFVVSGASDESTRLRALKLGADDYVVKPFSIRELELRISNFLARQRERGASAATGTTAWAFAGWTLDPARRVVYAGDGREAPLTRGEFDLLLGVVRGEGAVVKRERLLSLLEGRGSPMSAESLTTLVYRLRRKLDTEPPVVVTVPGVGLRLGPPVTRVPGGAG